MPDPTPFALWQNRTGYIRAVDAAKVLGISRQSVTDLRAGRTQPHPSTRRLMEIIEERPEIGMARLTVMY